MREGPLGFLIKILEKVERGTAAEGKEGMARRRLILSHSRSISSSQIGNADLASRRGCSSRVRTAHSRAAERAGVDAPLSRSSALPPSPLIPPQISGQIPSPLPTRTDGRWKDERTLARIVCGAIAILGDGTRSKKARDFVASTCER